MKNKPKLEHGNEELNTRNHGNRNTKKLTTFDDNGQRKKRQAGSKIENINKGLKTAKAKQET